MIRVRRAARDDAAAIGRVHVETWQATYAGLLPDSMLVAMSDVRQSAWWSQLLADPGEARGVFVADDQEMGVVGFGSCGPVRDPPEDLERALDGRAFPEHPLYNGDPSWFLPIVGAWYRTRDWLDRRLAA